MSISNAGLTLLTKWSERLKMSCFDQTPAILLEPRLEARITTAHAVTTCCNVLPPAYSNGRGTCRHKHVVGAMEVSPAMQPEKCLERAEVGTRCSPCAPAGVGVHQCFHDLLPHVQACRLNAVSVALSHEFCAT